MRELFATTVANAKPRPREYKLGDGGGLYLLVRPSGTKLWRLNYRHLSRQKTLSFGMWPDVSLASAREKREKARREIAAGLDPAEQTKLEQLHAMVATLNTFEAIAEEWYAKNERERRAPITLRKIRWLLDIAYPTLGSRPITAITAQEVLLVLRKVEATGRHESARRMRSVLSRVFRYAIATARAERDIAVDLRGAITTPTVKHMAAITDPTAFGGLLRAIDGYEGHAITTYALKITPHVFVRPGELRKWEWAEIDFQEGIWKIPPEKMKMNRPHNVFLSTQVRALIMELYDLTGDGKYLFPSFRSRERPMSENTITAALRAMGYGPEQMTAHGFRATADTLLNELNLFNPDAIERQLAHLDRDAVRRAYVRGQYWDERVQIMQYWSDYIDELRESGKIARPVFGASRVFSPAQGVGRFAGGFRGSGPAPAASGAGEAALFR